MWRRPKGQRRSGSFFCGNRFQQRGHQLLVLADARDMDLLIRRMRVGNARLDGNHIHLGIGFFEQFAFQTRMNYLNVGHFVTQRSVNIAHKMHHRRVDICPSSRSAPPATRDTRWYRLAANQQLGLEVNAGGAASMPMPLSAPSVVPRALTYSPATHGLMGSRVKSSWGSLFFCGTIFKCASISTERRFS